ncbi:tRNA-(MS[2]IO[6]A)-hydroxylase [Flavobacterium indicum GPTSA100-9 = DSM 17447]|uniref:tRNA-(MS[2]IO[6]A)-hydroxylase n=1 Tax=Flavobacterium indicum (strain DSM 17447 / CIP 109464 / GPTSA100-9) TaxID=1094466 RepID=H8XVC7_FLAIG|nr:tRNA-(ms[2]io[6]A)-hydroxylase [Flavobacterium indicum]CCG53097.1 tRNA-(MS[2]IO[6]A)-hydroxylase [Flavobacterium indicum GPTSA100-9 = DSM 17447]
MLRLQLPTDPRWVNIVESNIGEILSDHAWCEQKAATNAINLIINNSEKEDLVSAMLEISIEEMEHFKMVHDLIKERGLEFERERKDDYVNELARYMKDHLDGSREAGLIERLLFAAMIEARSCERFKVLSENINDEKLAQFYRDLMESEASHYTTFIGFARKYAEKIDVEKRWQEWLDFEASVIAKYGKKETIHG